MKMTPRKKEIYDFVNSYTKKNHFSPSQQEIAKKLKLAVSTVNQHLSELKESGYILKEKNRTRSLKVKPRDLMVSIPLLGTIAAGEPLHIFEEESEQMTIPKNKLPSSGKVFALRVKGNSMIDENVHDGDTILVRSQQTAQNGDKVVALIDNNEVTLKKFYQEKDHVRLQPANKAMNPIIIHSDRSFSIQGIMLDLIRNEKESNEKPKIKNQFLRESVVKPQKINKFCEFWIGDSLLVLDQLEPKYTTIYLDPPFNSNRNYKYAATDDESKFDDTWKGNDYEEWLERLIYKSKSKLLQNGTLFFHISAELSFTPEKVLRKHFKRVETIFWKKAHGKNTVKNKLGAVIDIIFKATNGETPKFNLLYVPLDEYYFEHSYKNVDSVGLYALGSIKHDKTRRGHMYSLEKNGVTYEAPFGWKIPREKLDELLKLNRIHFTKPKTGTDKGMMYKKLYKHEVKGKPLSNLWDDIAYITRSEKDKRLYPTQKPVDLLKRIIEMSSHEGDWVLDPVAGSGTTGAAASLLKRNATLIDLSKDSEKIIKERLSAIS